MAFPRKDAGLETIRAIVARGDGKPGIILNLNRYVVHAGYPDGQLYGSYMSVLEALLSRVGAAILWRAPILGQPVGKQAMDEVLAVGHSTHRTFLDLPKTPGAEENYRLRRLCVEEAVIHRCAGDRHPLCRNSQ